MWQPEAHWHKFHSVAYQWQRCLLLLYAACCVLWLLCAALLRYWAICVCVRKFMQRRLSANLWLHCAFICRISTELLKNSRKIVSADWQRRGEMCAAYQCRAMKIISLKSLWEKVFNFFGEFT